MNKDLLVPFLNNSVVWGDTRCYVNNTLVIYRKNYEFQTTLEFVKFYDNNVELCDVNTNEGYYMTLNDFVKVIENYNIINARFTGKFTFAKKGTRVRLILAS